MFGLNWIEMLAIAALVVIVVAVIAKRNTSVQDQLLKLLPNAGDRALLELQAHIPDNQELRDKARALLDAADAKFEAEAKGLLEKRGWQVTKPATVT